MKYAAELTAKRMEILEFQTKRHKQAIDITESINERLPVGEGVIHLFALHTTVGLTTADLDPGTDLDMLDAFDALIPKLAYRHPHDPAHAPDHILSALIGTSLCIPFQGKSFVLGAWQRIVLVEFNGPQTRRIACTVLNR